MNPDSTHLKMWIRIWIEKYASWNPRANGTYVYGAGGTITFQSPQTDQSECSFQYGIVSDSASYCPSGKLASNRVTMCMYAVVLGGATYRRI